MSAPADLASLADCKAWLGLTSSADDAVLAELITAVSRAILADLGRPVLLPSLVGETLDGHGGSSLVLRHWPASAIVSLTLDGVAIAPATAPGQAGFVLDAPEAAPPGAMQRLHMRGAVFPHGAQTILVTYRAGYEIRAEPAAVPATAPFVVTAQAPFGAWALDTGVTGASAPYGVAGGVYTFDPADAGASVALSYGYVPADLARATCEWVADRYAARTRIGQSAKTLGGQETTSFIVKAMPDVVDRLLRPYRRVAA